MADMGIERREATPQFISNFGVCENHNPQHVPHTPPPDTLRAQLPMIGAQRNMSPRASRQARITSLMGY